MMNDLEKRLLRALVQLHKLDYEKQFDVSRTIEAVIKDTAEAFDWDAFFVKNFRKPQSPEYNRSYYVARLTHKIVNTEADYEKSKTLEPSTFVPADPTFSPLQEKLATFIKDIQKPYYFHNDPPFLDFNKEIVAPGLLDNFPDGVLGIRCDDDFWAVAGLPLEFDELETPEIVEVLWPEFREEASYGPDSITTAEDVERSKEWEKTRAEREKPTALDELLSTPDHLDPSSSSQEPEGD